MAFTNFFQDLSTHTEWILFLLCFGFVLCFGSVTFVLVHCIIQVVEAAVAFYLFDILYYYIYEESSKQFFAELFSHILSARLELKSFVLLLCLIFTIHHSIKEIASVLRERLSPSTAIIVDCPDHRQSRLEIITAMQSPQLSQLADEMTYIIPSKLMRPKSNPFTNDSQLKDISPTIFRPATPNEVCFASHLNRYMHHPWGVVDYYIYLLHIESGRNKLRRKKECYLLETTGFTQVTLHDEPVLNNLPTHTNPTVIFVSLPVPDMQNEFSNARLVLGFDLQSDRLQGYFFEPEAPIENYEDLWKVWNQGEGELVIDVPVDRFLAIVRYTMEHQIEILEIGVLHHYGLITREFQAGLDMVVTLQFLQFVDDFAELLAEEPDELRELYTPFQDELRELLATGSRDTWFAVRDGLNMEQYRQKQLKKVVASGLFHGQNMFVLRDESEGTENDEPRPVKIVPGHSHQWSRLKLRIQILVSATLIICLCSIFERDRVLCVGMF
ncbi:hypothetical protein CBS147339_7169 [Penicillium roqueforti]|nr:hypothetical protein CBS147354_6451 [Penicillium roqueforti]KAI2748537.1 hypothetical protein DTO012A8_9878 [Penicillium roqueforti]KAI3071200.1 hypothetical protein CBS147339_7169 [Penicillium roqueforti]KAI3101225.1 hypothetical protein CBS147338_3085 [Penicillium roqueforti]KAI3183764.1 hypothetical protein DTO032C6_6671 [Penicillium roqueforti]